MTIMCYTKNKNTYLIKKTNCRHVLYLPALKNLNYELILDKN